MEKEQSIFCHFKCKLRNTEMKAIVNLGLFLPLTVSKGCQSPLGSVLATFSAKTKP